MLAGLKAFFAFWEMFHDLLLYADFFLQSNFSKNYFRNIIRVSNSLDLDQTRQNVGPDLGPNCLQRLCYQQTTLVGKEIKMLCLSHN